MFRSIRNGSALSLREVQPQMGCHGEEAASQDTYPGQSKLTLFAREGAASASPFSRGVFVAAVPFEVSMISRRLARRRKRGVSKALALVAMFAPASQSSLSGVASAVEPPRMQSPQPSPGGRVVTDEVGRRVAIPAEVRRVVSLAPNLTETLYALGLGDRVAGDTEYCDIPPEAKGKPHVGTPVNPSIEAIVALHPDLVFATTSINRRETVDALARLHIAVYATDPRTIRAMIDSFGRMADLVGAPEKGAALIAKLDAMLDSLHARLADLPPVHVLFVVWFDPLITIGQNTFIADALRWAGAESVVLSHQNWPQLNFEEAVRLQPDYIVLAESHTGEGSHSIENLRSRAAWRDLRAVQLGHIAIISEEIDRPAPGLIDAIQQLARELHPSAFALNARRKSIAKIPFESRVTPRPAQARSCECAL